MRFAPALALLVVLSFPAVSEASHRCADALPVEVGAVSASTSKGAAVLRAHGGAAVGNVRVYLKRGRRMVARGTFRGTFRRTARVPLRFRSRARTGRYRAVVTGEVRGCRRAKAADRVRLRAVPPPSADFPAPPQGFTPASPETATPPAQPPPVVQGVTIDWSGGNSAGRDRVGIVLPGIGTAELRCNTEIQWLRVFPDGGRETSMMNWTYKRWDDQFDEYALREAQRTRFTGPDFNEGLNKFGPTPERLSKGSFTGIISDRLGFDEAGGPGNPPTSFRLSWQWDFSGGTQSFCRATATFVSDDPEARVSRSAAVNWRGDAAAAQNGLARSTLAGLGEIRVRCEAGTDGTRRLTVAPFDGVGSAEVTTFQGSVAETVPFEQGPFEAPLPNNGLVQIRFANGYTLLASTRWKVNDPDAAQNFCHVASQAFAPSA